MAIRIFPAESLRHVQEESYRKRQWDINFLLFQPTDMTLTVGVLALQGAFFEHVQLLKKAAEQNRSTEWEFIEVRTPQELARCDGLVLPGGESTTMSLVAARSNLLEPLRDFVK